MHRNNQSQHHCKGRETNHEPTSWQVTLNCREPEEIDLFLSFKIFKWWHLTLIVKTLILATTSLLFLLFFFWSKDFQKGGCNLISETSPRRSEGIFRVDLLFTIIEQLLRHSKPCDMAFNWCVIGLESDLMVPRSPLNLFALTIQ